MVLTRLLRLNATVYGIVIGLVLGLTVFVAMNWLILKGGEVVGPHLASRGQFFIGYRVTFIGSLIGLAYGLIVGFVIGYAVGRTYNWLANDRENQRIRPVPRVTSRK